MILNDTLAHKPSASTADSEGTLSKSAREAQSLSHIPPHPPTSNNIHPSSSPAEPAQKTYWSSTGELDTSAPFDSRQSEPSVGARVGTEEENRLRGEVVYWKVKAEAFERKLRELKSILDG